MKRAIAYICASAVLILTASGPAFSRPTGVPEIDPSLASSAIALLTGGLLILKSKFGRK